MGNGAEIRPLDQGRKSPALYTHIHFIYHIFRDTWKPDVIIIVLTLHAG